MNYKKTKKKNPAKYLMIINNTCKLFINGKFVLVVV